MFRPFASVMMLALFACAGTLARAAEPATTQATTAATTTAAAAPAGKVSPEAAAVLSNMGKAYGDLKGVEIAGKLSGDFDVDGQKRNEGEPFTSSFAAPNRFRYVLGEDFTAGSTGEKFFIHLKSANIYRTIDAPKAKVVSAKLPEPFGEMLRAQNLSLALAMSSNPEAELPAAYASVEKGTDVAIDGKPYTALKLSNQKGQPTSELLVDPATHFVRRIVTDLSPELLARGAQNVKQATLTVDYTTTTPQGEPKADQFAWAPPAGARDAATVQQDDAGGEAAAALEGKPAPAFKLKDLEDKEVSLADLKGQVVVLDFWATWCGPCVQALPGLDKLYQAKKEAGVKVFAVNQGEEKELVQGFIKSKNLSLPVLMDGDMKVGAAYKADVAIPVTVVIGKDGIVRKAFTGVGPNTHAELEAAIDAAAKATK